MLGTGTSSIVLTREQPVSFSCNGAALVGVAHLPAATPRVGVVIVVGGPQFRVGSHRQFLSLARHLAASGIAVLRFDCRGMGDSEGDFPGFAGIGDDIHAAIDALQSAVPSLRRVVLWGLCDAASAIAFYAPSDDRVAGVVLLNPWVRTAKSLAQAHVKYYYLQRLVDAAFWRKLMRGEFALTQALGSFAGDLRQAIGARGAPASGEENLPERMAVGIEKFRGPTLLLLSGRDFTAKEFEDAARRSKRWQRILARADVERRDFAEADHTFSRRSWRDQVAHWTRAWIDQLAIL